MLVEAQKDKPDEPSAGPSLRDWGPYSPLLATLIEEVRQGNILTLAVATQGKNKGKFIPVPRPSTIYQRLMSKARMETRIRKHDGLVAKLLGDRAKKSG